MVASQEKDEREKKDVWTGAFNSRQKQERKNDLEIAIKTPWTHLSSNKIYITILKS